MAWLVLVALVVVVLAAITDCGAGLIPNWLTVPLFAAGVGWWGWQAGWQGAADALLSALVYTATTFAFAPAQGKWPGGGDLKLVAAVGACLGLEAWTWYYPGIWAGKAFWGLLVRVKVYGPSLKAVVGGFWAEVLGGDWPRVGGRNFRFMQRAALKAGLDPEMVYIQPPLWIAVGVLMAIWGV